MLINELILEVKTKTIYIYFIKQKLFGYSPFEKLLLNKIDIYHFCFYLYLTWRISLLILEDYDDIWKSQLQNNLSGNWFLQYQLIRGS